MDQNTENEQMANQEGTARGGQKFCSDCGNGMSAKAEICPNCGVRQNGAPQGKFNKLILVLLTFFLGGLGAHKLYLKKYIQAALYLLFSWTGIPAIIAFIEFIIYLVTSEDDLARKYGEPSTSALVVAIVIPFVGLFFVGIIAAIAIPQFAAYSERAYNSAAQADLRNCSTGAEIYYADYQKFPQDLNALSQYCMPSNNVSIYYSPINTQDYQIISFHADGTKAYGSFGSKVEITDWDKIAIEAELSGLNISDQRGNLMLIK